MHNQRDEPRSTGGVPANQCDSMVLGQREQARAETGNPAGIGPRQGQARGSSRTLPPPVPPVGSGLRPAVGGRTLRRARRPAGSRLRPGPPSRPPTSRSGGTASNRRIVPDAQRHIRPENPPGRQVAINEIELTEPLSVCRWHGRDLTGVAGAAGGLRGGPELLVISQHPADVGPRLLVGRYLVAMRLHCTLARVVSGQGQNHVIESE